MNNQTFGERIAELRRKRSMTQESLAGIIGVSAQAVSKWENSATMPDILLLPLLADTLCVSIDALFGLPCKTREEPIPIEETPAAVYDKILTTMCRWDCSVSDEAQYLANAKAGFAKNPRAHTGFVSQTAGAVYADRDMALAYLPNNADSVQLLEKEGIGAFLQVLSEENVRRVLAYQCRNPEQTFTAASVSAKIGIAEEDARDALEKLCDYTLTAAMNVDVGGGETLRVYRAYGLHKLPLLLYPLLTLAGQLADFHEAWHGLRG